MTLDDIERQNRGFMDFLAISGCKTHFGLRDTFQERIAPKSSDINMEKLHRPMKFSALNVDFDGPNLDFLGLRKPAHEGIKERYVTLVKVIILPLLASFS